jgi:hypothetical protein
VLGRENDDARNCGELREHPSHDGALALGHARGAHRLLELHGQRGADQLKVPGVPPSSRVSMSSK